MVPKAASHGHAHTQSHGHGVVGGHRVRPRSRSGSLSIARSPSVLSAGTVFPPPLHPPTDLEQGFANVHAQVHGHGHGNGHGAQAISTGADTSAVATTAAAVAGGGTGAGVVTAGAGYGLRRVVSNHTRYPSAFAPLGSIESTDDLSSLQTKTSKDDFDIEHRAELERRLAYDNHSNSNPYKHDYEYDVKPAQPVQHRNNVYERVDEAEQSYTADKSLISSITPFSHDANASAEYLVSHHSPVLALGTASNSISDSEVEASDKERGGRGGGKAGYDGPFQPPDSRELFGILASVSAVCVLAVAAGMTTIFDWVL